MRKKILLTMVLPAFVLGCATVPTAPSVMALPGRDKHFDQFMVDDAACRQFSAGQVGANSDENATVVRSATIGTVIGALAGAAIGGRDGAAVGAGLGLLTGTAAGSGEQRRSGRYGSQRQYDQSYVQCMYARGHKVPVQGVMMESASPAGAIGGRPSPPPGLPPPPPPNR